MSLRVEGAQQLHYRTQKKKKKKKSFEVILILIFIQVQVAVRGGDLKEVSLSQTQLTGDVLP